MGKAEKGWADCKKKEGAGSTCEGGEGRDTSPTFHKWFLPCLLVLLHSTEGIPSRDT